jgi:galactitol-specific phosphotransferase system IIC component
MKKDAISTGLFIAIGFLCVAIVIAILIPVVRDVINDADDNRPVIPSVSEAHSSAPVQTETAALVFFNHGV